MLKNTKVATLSFVVSIFVLFFKTQAYYATHSVGILSDALETVANVLTAIVALLAIRLASEPADESHPYGHGKMEYFSAAFEGGLILFAALAIIHQAGRSLLTPNLELHVFEGNSYLLAATLLNLGLGGYLVYYGKRRHSEALKASGKHLMSDVITTAAVFAGLILVDISGLVWIDSLVGILAGLYLLYEAINILVRNANALMDGTDMQSVSDLAKIFNSKLTPETIDIHNVKIIRSGSFHHIDAHIVVPEYLDVATVHQLTHAFEEEVVKAYRCEGEIAFHIDPCKKSFCAQCSMKECKIRKVEFKFKKHLQPEDLVKGPRYTN